MEKTVVLVKPGGVKRALVGEIVSRFEKVGLKIVSMKMIWVDKSVVEAHYSDNQDYLISIGEKTIENYKKYGKDPKEDLGVNTPLEMGQMIRQWNMDFITSGPVVAMLLEGIHAVEVVRKIVGSTFPSTADPGSIRGSYSIDAPMLANQGKRVVRNLVHASGNVEEAEFERKLWFKENEIYQYTRSDEIDMFE